MVNGKRYIFTSLMFKRHSSKYADIVPQGNILCIQNSEVVPMPQPVTLFVVRTDGEKVSLTYDERLGGKIRDQEYMDATITVLEITKFPDRLKNMAPSVGWVTIGEGKTPIVVEFDYDKILEDIAHERDRNQHMG
jgi:hypothetical protein